MRHASFPTLPDDFQIGQESVARIQMEQAQAIMAKYASDAYGTGYVNPEWRAMTRRIMSRARDQYDAAKEVMGHINEAR